MSCGVVAIVDPCDLDPNECKITQLCEKSTKNKNGQTVWNSAAQGYVDLAKEYEPVSYTHLTLPTSAIV